MKYFLAKTDPETYSIDQFEREKKTVWDGVKNPQALRAISEMRPGDRVFLYHSGGDAAVAAVLGSPNSFVVCANDHRAISVSAADEIPKCAAHWASSSQ